MNIDQNEALNQIDPEFRESIKKAENLAQSAHPHLSLDTTLVATRLS